MKGLMFKWFLVPLIERMYPGYDWNVPNPKRMSADRLAEIVDLSRSEAWLDEIHRVANRLGKGLVRKAKSQEDVMLYRGGLVALEMLESNIKAIAKQKKKK